MAETPREELSIDLTAIESFGFAKLIEERTRIQHELDDVNANLASAAIELAARRDEARARALQTDKTAGWEIKRDPKSPRARLVFSWDAPAQAAGEEPSA